jgi:acetyl-CoA carboxylase carboxyltransferase component
MAQTVYDIFTMTLGFSAVLFLVNAIKGRSAGLAAWWSAYSTFSLMVTLAWFMCGLYLG